MSTTRSPRARFLRWMDAMAAAWLGHDGKQGPFCMKCNERYVLGLCQSCAEVFAKGTAQRLAMVIDTLVTYRKALDHIATNRCESPASCAQHAIDFSHAALTMVDVTEPKARA